MKKIIALILSIVLLGSCAAALAEEAEKGLIGTVSVNGVFNVQCRMAEGYKISLLESGSDSVSARIQSEDKTRPRITLKIAFNDSYTQDGVAMKLNDVSEEVMELIKDSFTEQSDVESFQDAETAMGTKLLIVRGTVGETNYVDAYSIFNSYEIEAVAVPGEEAAESTLTDEQVQMIIDFFSDMDFEEVK